MANYYAGGQPANPAYGNPSAPGGAQNLQFYQSSYGAPTGNTVPAGGAAPQSSYGFGGSSPGNFGGGAASFGSPAFGGAGAGVSGRMGEQAGLRTGWLAAFSTEGYDGEPPLLEELGVNFGHIQAKVPWPFLSRSPTEMTNLETNICLVSRPSPS